MMKMKTDEKMMRDQSDFNGARQPAHLQRHAALAAFRSNDRPPHLTPKEQSMREFWMVWNPEDRLPRVRHRLESLAVNEAERLARANPGQQFFVLRATSVSKVELPCITKRLEPRNDLLMSNP